MVAIPELWLAILLAAVIVWFASAIVWMALPHHKKDFKALPDEQAARDVLGSQNLAPGQYDIPHCADMSDLKTEEGRQKFTDGPVGFMTILPNGIPSMGKNLVLTFTFYLAVGVMVAYVAGRTLPPGTEYLTVFRLTGTVAWLAYGMAVVPDAIWFGRPWSSIIKTVFDALLYALLTAGVFAWLWPAAS